MLSGFDHAAATALCADRWSPIEVLDTLSSLLAKSMLSRVVDDGQARADAFGDAAAHLGAANRLRADIGTPVPAVETSDREQAVTATRAALGPGYRAAVLAGATRLLAH